MKKLLSLAFIIYAFILLVFAGFLIYARIVDYRPDRVIPVDYSLTPDLLTDTSKITILSWNLEYFGKDQSMDHHKEKSTSRLEDKQRIVATMKAASAFLENNRDYDFMLFSGVDVDSKRSAEIHQYDSLSKLFPDRLSSFAFNYKVEYVPYPIKKPIGKVKSGLMTIGKYIPTSSVRYAFPADINFPHNLFNYDRCFMVSRYDISNEKELLIINLQASESEDEQFKSDEISFLTQFLKDEYRKGNYIIAGGDWNQTPAGFKPQYKQQKNDDFEDSDLNIDGMIDWKCYYDGNVPSVRSYESTYKKGDTPTSTHDFFLVSPNIDFITIKCIETGFKYSIHQPVRVILKLRE